MLSALVVGNTTIEVMMIIAMDDATIYHSDFEVNFGFSLGLGRIGIGAIIGSPMSWFHVTGDVI